MLVFEETRTLSINLVSPASSFRLGRAIALCAASRPSSLEEQGDSDYCKEKVKGELGNINPRLFGHVSDSP
jgi:hypothetical protein